MQTPALENCRRGPGACSSAKLPPARECRCRRGLQLWSGFDDRHRALPRLVALIDVVRRGRQGLPTARAVPLPEALHDLQGPLLIDLGVDLGHHHPTMPEDHSSSLETLLLADPGRRRVPQLVG